MKAEDTKNQTADECRELAHELKVAFDTVSPFIEKHTEIVCPECREVCCADRHGRHDRSDLLFLKLLDVEISASSHKRQEDDSCRFIGKTGCCLERWMRPYRCTFFFCDILLKSMESDNAKFYRTFLDYFQHLVSLRQKLFT